MKKVQIRKITGTNVRFNLSLVEEGAHRIITSTKDVVLFGIDITIGTEDGDLIEQTDEFFSLGGEHYDISFGSGRKWAKMDLTKVGNHIAEHPESTASNPRIKIYKVPNLQELPNWNQVEGLDDFAIIVREGLSGSTIHLAYKLKPSTRMFSGIR